MTEFETALVDVLNRLAAAVEKIGGSGGGGGGKGSGRKREKPPIDQCMQETDQVGTVVTKKTKSDNLYLALKLRGGFTTNIFDDVDAVGKILDDAMASGRKVTIYYTKKAGSKYNDFVSIKFAGNGSSSSNSPGAPNTSAAADFDDDAPF